MYTLMWYRGPMIIDSLAGRFYVTASSDPDRVTVTADSRDTLVSVLDGVELVGGAHGEDRAFTDDAISWHTVVTRRKYSIELSRAELLRYLEYEVLNYLTYSSLNEMRTLTHTHTHTHSLTLTKDTTS